MTLAHALGVRLAEARAVPFRGDTAPLPDAPATPAAVLIAITDAPAPGVILTQRPDTMRRHPGQVAFPGGRVDPGDPNATAAALREAWEEVGLPPRAVQILGALPPYRTVTGFEIVPVVGMIPADVTLVPDDREVAAVFEAPLAWLIDPANRVERTMAFNGTERRFLELQWDRFRIWGATAAIIANLAARLGP